MRTLLTAALLLLAVSASAESFTIYGANLPCNEYRIIAWPDARLIPPPIGQDAVLGAASSRTGVPTDAYAITATELLVEGSEAVQILAVIGKLDVAGTGGDYISPRLLHVGSERQTFLPGREPIFRAGDELHLHFGGACSEDARGFNAFATIYYQRLAP